MQDPVTKSDLQATLRLLEQRLDARIARLEAQQSDDRMNKRVWESTISLGVLFLAGGVLLWSLK